jgi:outer membrane receptor protein involved in Fe transport
MDDLSSGALNNTGKARNKGLEFTLRKLLSHHYYFLANASLFSSKYRASDGIWYNTYFNTNYIYNLLAGTSFRFGKQRRNTLEFKLRGNLRGGFRYTPVDQEASQLTETVVYEYRNNFANQLPPYKRIDFGVSFRMNKRRSAYTWMVDLQNILNEQNVIRRTFGFQNKSVTVYDTKSLGLLPMITLKAEF